MFHWHTCLARSNPASLARSSCSVPACAPAACRHTQSFPSSSRMRALAVTATCSASWRAAPAYATCVRAQEA